MNLLPPFLSARHAVATLLAGAALIASGAAFAGECPTEYVLATPRAVEEKPDIGVARPTLTVVHLKDWRGVGDLYLRMRQLTIAANGIVPTHQHDDRPSIVYVAKGELIEHSSFCAVPILHKEGEWSPEFGAGHEHWWENRTGKEVVVISADVIPPEFFDPGSEHLRDAKSAGQHDM
jgi:quercetin dioxygenase-like cupin family protein